MVVDSPENRLRARPNSYRAKASVRGSATTSPTSTVPPDVAATMFSAPAGMTTPYSSKNRWRMMLPSRWSVVTLRSEIVTSTRTKPASESIWNVLTLISSRPLPSLWAATDPGAASAPNAPSAPTVRVQSRRRIAKAYAGPAGAWSRSVTGLPEPSTQLLLWR